MINIAKQITSYKSQWFSNSLLRNGRATQRPAGPDDGPRLGPQSADTHRKQVMQDAAALLLLPRFFVLNCFKILTRPHNSNVFKKERNQC